MIDNSNTIFSKFCKDSAPLSILADKDFGECFEQLVLVCPFYILLTLICIFYIVKASCRPIRSGNINRAWIVYTRIFFHVAIISTEAVLIYEQYAAANNPVIINVIAESLILLSWSLSALVVCLWRKSWHSVSTGRDPDILVVSWVLALISCSFELHSAILAMMDDQSALDNGSFTKYECYNVFIRWSLYLMLIILQIPKSNVQTTAPQRIVNSDEEAGSSRGYSVPEHLSEHSFSLLSRVFFQWVTRLFSDAQISQFPSVEHLTFTLPPNMNPAAVHCQLKLGLRQYSTSSFSPLPLQTNSSGNVEDLMEPLLKSSTASTKSDKFFLIKSINKAFGWSFWPLNLVKFVSAVLELSCPVILNLFLKELESGTREISTAAVFLGILVAVTILKSFIDTHLTYKVDKLKITTKGSIISELYSKVLSINATGIRKFSVGEITNFASQDADQITDHMICFFEIWNMPLKLIVTFYLLYHYIGVAFFAGLGFCVLLIPINQYLAKKLHDFEHSLMKHRDERIKIVHEVITNMKSIKFFSWEQQFIDKISKMRSVEVTELRWISYVDAICVFFWGSAPCIITFLVIITYAFLGGSPTASVIFTTLALVHQVIEPLNALPWVIMGFIMAWISIKRVQSFFELPDNSPDKMPVPPPFNSHNVIEVDNCSFYWKEPEECCLTGINFQVNKGELMVVMGKTGSGKSSLLLGLSQELNLACGELRLKEWREGCGLVLQDAWIKSGTIRETILDGSTFDLYWYESVVSACALDKDIRNFPEGDNTSVGVSGAALSGGQKLRLSLARAVYKNKQVYLIDDIFAGLDSNVGLHIYEHCINGLLANKTRIVCTHHERLSTSADTLIVLEDGKIKYIGLPQVFDLPNTKDETQVTKPDENKKTDEDEVTAQPQYEEERNFGSINVTVYRDYAKAAGFCLTGMVFIFMVGMQGSDTLSNWWLTVWVKFASTTPQIIASFIGSALNGFSGYIAIHDYNLTDDRTISNSLDANTTFYLTVYGSMIASNSVFTLLRAFSFALFGVSATTVLHNNMLKSVMGAALHFFDKTPVGVIINRFSRDVYSVDWELPFMLNILLAEFFILLGTIVMTCYGLPYVLLTIIPVMILYYFIQKYYRTAVREIKRLYAMSQSPLFSHFEETLNGNVFIHASRQSDSAQVMGLKLLKSYQRTSFCLAACSGWLNLRLQLLAAGVLAAAAGIILIEMHQGTINIAVLSLAVTYALTINTTLMYVVQASTEIEMEFVGAERVLQYTHGLPIQKEKDELQLVDLNWPSEGVIEFLDVSVRYEGCTTRALNHISFKIKSGEKVGIVGRTGAGKSTIFLALFRLCDIETGHIVIDGTNIHDIGGTVLRKKLSIIPQQQLIFSGSIRENIDPFGVYDDETILSTLKRCALTDYVTANGGLDHEISSKMLSVGQRQLFCLARALLVKSKVICLDEATSNIDMETDKLIQEIIREDFATSTIVTVAHRLETIMDYDKIIVISHGTVTEEGPPQQLMDNHKSLFYSLARSSGLVPHNNKLLPTGASVDSDASISSMSDVKF